MSMHLLPPLRFRATVERNVETELSPTRSPLPPRFAPHLADLRCFFWEPREIPGGRGMGGLQLGPNTDKVVEGPRLLVRRDADVKIGDEITEIRTRGGVVVRAGRLRIVEDLWRSTHREIGLELVTGIPVTEAAYS